MALPPSKRNKFVKAVEAMDNPTAKRRGEKSSGLQSKLVQWPDVLARSQKNFGDLEIPNLVLLEREEQEF